MEIYRFYLGCLAHASYLIENGGEAAVVDPQRDVDIYLEAAKERGLRIRWVIETHLHADFVSGHLELAERTGATICLGAGSGATFPHRDLSEGDVLPLGSEKLRVLSTPGHTLESVCIVAGNSVFTGDTLFIGDVGRPDLSPSHTPQQLAGMLFDSIHRKLLTLPDDTVVYPAHGAGSLCGRQMSSEATSTIGRERATNYALQTRSREEFVELLTSDLPARPTYFAEEVERNRSGAAPLVAAVPLRALSQDEVGDAVLLDTRSAMEFASAHAPGSINVGLGGQFASWAARLLGLDRDVVLIAEDENAVNEARMRLARVGIEKVNGYLKDGIAGWQPLEPLMQIAASDVAGAPGTILDVREPGERGEGFIAGSINIPLGQLSARMNELPREGMIFVHCKGGYRSS
ncbi:MAG: MBL fold metallo-hydrolase, partial [Acidobacteriota bacterium]|nr:MBL fold metallo-hydrolase [Acidobacteriota bacterium]